MHVPEYVFVCAYELLTPSFVHACMHVASTYVGMVCMHVCVSAGLSPVGLHDELNALEHRL